MSNPTDRPWLSFDTDGTPRVHIPLANGGDISVACSFDGLTAFVGEVRAALVERAADPSFQKQVGQTLLEAVRRWLPFP